MINIWTPEQDSLAQKLFGVILPGDKNEIKNYPEYSCLVKTRLLTLAIQIPFQKAKTLLISGFYGIPIDVTNKAPYTTVEDIINEAFTFGSKIKDFGICTRVFYTHILLNYEFPLTAIKLSEKPELASLLTQLSLEDWLKCWIKYSIRENQYWEDEIS